MSELFETLDLETISLCNRTCPTCIRNSHPDKDAVASFFEPNYLPMWVIDRALSQSRDLGFTGDVILSHYNEPLLDERLPFIAAAAKSVEQFRSVYFHTNGDMLDDKLASELDIWVDEIRVSLYMDEPVRSERADWICSLFKYTKITILDSTHIPTHFSPAFDVAELARKHKNNNCLEPQRRVIINHRQEFLLCCDDVVGNFDLGTFPETSIAEFWFGEKRQKIVNDLQNSGGRLKYPYCSTCPRP